MDVGDDGPSGLAGPFGLGLYNIVAGNDKGFLYMAIGIVPYLICCLVLIPWFAATYATAYDALNKEYELSHVDVADRQS